MTEEDEEFERIASKCKETGRINESKWNLEGIKVMSADEFRDMLRNETLEEVAQEFDKMKFGDTSQSFAIFVRNMKK